MRMGKTTAAKKLLSILLAAALVFALLAFRPPDTGAANAGTHVAYQNAEGETLGAFDSPFKNPDFKRVIVDADGHSEQYYIDNGLDVPEELIGTTDGKRERRHGHGRLSAAKRIYVGDGR
jgi:hypothetical protein